MSTTLPEGTIVGSFVNCRQQKIHTLHIPSEQKDGPVNLKLFVLHGLKEHSGRPIYTRLYEEFRSKGNVDIYSLDHHGHGQSEGTRFYCDKFDDYIDDVVDFINIVQKQSTQTSKLMLFGHSLGGLISALASLRLPQDQLAGLIMTSPATGVKLSCTERFQLLFSPILNTLCPKAKLVKPISYEYLTRNEDELDIIRKDPFCPPDNVPIRFGVEFVRASALLENTLRSEIKCPLIVLHGTLDKVTDQPLSLEFFKSVKSPSQEKLYIKADGFYHEIFNEPEREPIVEIIANFVCSGGDWSKLQLDRYDTSQLSQGRVLTLKLVEE